MNNHFYARLLTASSLFGMIGVSFGAFGAHFLKSRIDANELDVLRTGVLYLFIHTLMILIIILLAKTDQQSRLLKSTGMLFTIGIILFSGSLFLIATKSLTGFDIGYFGILTPAGGLCFIIGWMLLFFYSFSYRI
jgi:uncharacterized membrane protein YgdD (TMEM256/DUF423 family)